MSALEKSACFDLQSGAENYFLQTLDFVTAMVKSHTSFL